MATRQELYEALFVSWDAFVQTVVANDGDGTSVSFDELVQDVLHITRTTQVGATAVTNTITVNKTQALWIIDQINRLMVTDPG